MKEKESRQYLRGRIDWLVNQLNAANKSIQTYMDWYAQALRTINAKDKELDDMKRSFMKMQHVKNLTAAKDKRKGELS